MRILRSAGVRAAGGRLDGYTVTGTGRVLARPPSSRAVTDTVIRPGATGAMVTTESARVAHLPDPTTSLPCTHNTTSPLSKEEVSLYINIKLEY